MNDVEKPQPLVWTRADQRLAATEGWQLVNPGPHGRIEMVDDPKAVGVALGVRVPPLPDDEWAWCAVVRGVLDVSATHRKALALISADEMKAMSRRHGSGLANFVAKPAVPS